MEMGKEVLILNLDDVLPNRFQPRIKFNEQNILELADSIKEHGVIQPIVVRKIADKYEIIAGERRYKASILAGKTTIPAIVTNLDDKNSAEIALIENVQRQDLTPIEEAISYKKILDMGYLNQASLAEKLGKTQSTIANKLRLLNLADEVQEALLEEKISERHARSLLKLNKEDQLTMLNRIMNERMTVRKTDEEIMKMLNETDSDTTSGTQLKIDPIPAVEPVHKEERIQTGMGPDFNIPTSPMVEKPVDNNVNVSVSEEKKNFINPGFMDIDKIESQAQDIFMKKEEPIIEEIKPEEMGLTVENSFEPSNLSEEVHPIEETVEQKPIVGRFFNMVNMNSEEQKNPNYVNDLEEKEVNMDFNKPVDTPPSEFQFHPFINETQNQPIENNESKAEIPTINSQNNQFITQPNFGNPNAVHMPLNPSSIETEADTLQTINPYTLNDDSEFAGPINSQVEIPNPKGNFRNNNINNTEIQPVMMNDSGEVIPSVDMKTVINTVRDCVSTIESYGYTVDEEEMDLENKYQVTIIIDKQ